MAWLEKRKRYRLRDRIDGKTVTVINNLGTERQIAQRRLEIYERAKAAGLMPGAIAPFTEKDCKELGVSYHGLAREDK